MISRFQRQQQSWPPTTWSTPDLFTTSTRVCGTCRCSMTTKCRSSFDCEPIFMVKIWILDFLNQIVFLKLNIKKRFLDYENNNNCPMNCNGKGDCVNGKCKCYPGFSGLDCSSSKHTTI